MKFGTWLVGFAAVLGIGLTGVVLAQEYGAKPPEAKAADAKPAATKAEEDAFKAMMMNTGPKAVTKVKADPSGIPTIKKELPAQQWTREDTPEFRGEGLFFQRCALCHLGYWRKGGPVPTYGPSLLGVLKDPAKEPGVRVFIQFGSAKMPGFPNTFTPDQLNDLIAYLKTI